MTSPAEQELEKCLKDKCCTATNGNGHAAGGDGTAFQSLPDFAETVAFVHQFGPLFELSPFSFDDLVQALQQLHPPTEQKYCPPNSLLDNLFAEILHYCGYKFDRSTLYNSLHKLIRRVNRWTATPFEADLLYQKSGGGRQIGANKCGRSKQIIHKNNDGLEEGEENNNGGHGDEQQQQQSWNKMETEEEEKEEKGEEEEQKVAPPTSEPDDDKPELSNLFVADVLRLVALLLDYLLQCVHEDGGLDTKFSDEQLHAKPLCVDSAGRKFWYFANDTWLFMEQGRPAWLDEENNKLTTTPSKRSRADKKEAEEAPATPTKTKPKRRKEKRHIRTIYDKKKRRKSDGERKRKKAREEEEEEEEEVEEQANVTQQEVDMACANLFTGTLFRFQQHTDQDDDDDHDDGDGGGTVDEASSHQPQQQHTAVADKLEQCLDKVRTIEQERRRKAAERERERWAAAASAMRMSSRVVALIEKRRAEEEQMRARKEKILAEKRRIAQEHLALLQEHRCLTDSDLRQNMSREERHRLRQQRVDEQRERDQLIAAGILLDHDDTNDEADEEEEENGHDNNDNDQQQYNTTEEDDDDAEDDDEWWTTTTADGGGQHGGLRQQRRHGTTPQRHRQRLLPVSRPVRVRKVRQQHCRFWRWASEAPVPSKIANFSPVPSPCGSSSSASASTAAAASSFCLLMGERQLPAEVKRKMSSFFAECSSMASSPASSSAFFTAAAPPPVAATPAATATKTSAIRSIRSVLQLPGAK
ncbi:hypothetical protein niasHS_016196 [Heterodera schachtii]|uniref:DDT domain-containing protein n=1 Tax=Heterodera schachtii TaxID=97005 RepID=A0ABD2ICV5_HETSC